LPGGQPALGVGDVFFGPHGTEGAEDVAPPVAHLDRHKGGGDYLGLLIGQHDLGHHSPLSAQGERIIPPPGRSPPRSSWASLSSGGRQQFTNGDRAHFLAADGEGDRLGGAVVLPPAVGERPARAAGCTPRPWSRGYSRSNRAEFLRGRTADASLHG